MGSLPDDRPLVLVPQTLIGPGAGSFGQPFNGECEQEPDRRDQPGPSARVSNASGIMVSATMARIAPAATAVMTAIAGRGLPRSMYPTGRTAADQRDVARRRRRNPPSGRTLHSGRTGQPFGTLEMKTAARTARPMLPRDQAEAEHHRLGYAVEQGADRDGGAAAGLSYSEGCWSANACGAGHRTGRARHWRRHRSPPREETDRGGQEPAERAASSISSKASAEMSTPPRKP